MGFLRKLFGSKSTRPEAWMPACKGDIAAVEKLLDEGADVNAMDRAGNTPLHWVILGAKEDMACGDIAEMQDWKDIAELLIARGADIEGKTDLNGETPLHSAVSYRCDTLVELLLAKGANIEARDRYGHTPLHHAAAPWISEGEPHWKGGYKPIVEFLLAKGVDIEAKDKDGETALHVAVCGGYDLEDEKAIVELLLAKGANTEARTNYGATPLDCACEWDYVGSETAVAAVLRKHGGKTGKELGG